MALATLAQGKAHLRITTPSTSPLSDEDTDIALKLAQAEDAILDYCGTTAYWRTVQATWTDETDVPLVVHAAIMLMLGHLYAHVGDDAAGTFRTPSEGIWQEIERLLARKRDPVLA